MEVDQGVAQEKICQALRDAVSSMNSAGGSASSRMEEESAEEDDGETMLPLITDLKELRSYYITGGTLHPLFATSNRIFQTIAM